MKNNKIPSGWSDEAIKSTNINLTIEALNELLIDFKKLEHNLFVMQSTVDNITECDKIYDVININQINEYWEAVTAFKKQTLFIRVSIAKDLLNKELNEL